MSNLYKTSFFLLILMCFLLFACRSEEVTPLTTASPNEVATMTLAPVDATLVTKEVHNPSQVVEETPTPISTPSPTSSNTPVSTRIPPSHTPTPSSPPTATPPATKPALIVFGLFGGDGGSHYNSYLGNNLPRLILYTDGQIIMREGESASSEDRNGFIFYQATLSPQEICSILTSIEDSGFFSVAANGSRWVDDAIYEFDDSVEFSDGGPDYIMQINSPYPKTAYIYHSYVPYVIDEIRATYDLLSNYELVEKSVYKPTEVMLWIEKSTKEDSQIGLPWPSELPPLAKLMASIDYETYQGVAIQENVDVLSDLFENRIKPLLFSDNGLEYVVTMRILLPHETPQTMFWGFQPSPRIEPFDCNE